jgi:outer membrane protein TolC
MLILDKKITACLLVFAFSAFNIGPLFSEEDPLNRSSLQLETLIEEVLRRNPNLEAAKERIRAAAEVVPRVQVIDDPEFRFMSDFNNLKSKSEFLPMLQYQISQTFPFPGKLGLKGKVAVEILKQFQNAKITTTKDLIVQAKKLYFKLVFNQSSLSINRTNREIAKNIIDDSLALYRSGIKGYEEVIKAQVELQTLDEELLTIEAERIFIVSMLNTILNRSQDEAIGQAIDVVNPSKNLSFQALEAIAMQERPELKELKAMVREQEMMAKLAKREYFPDITIAAGYEQMTHNLSDNAWEASISFKIPLWIGQRQKRQFREAKAKASANANALLGMKAMIQGQIQDILGKLKAVEEKLLLYETGLLPKIAEALKASEISYRTGKGDFLILLDTRRQYQTIELTFEGIKADREILLAELERAIGIPLEEVQ